MCITANYSILQKHNTSCFLHKTLPWHGDIKQKTCLILCALALSMTGKLVQGKMDWVRIDAISSSSEGAEGGLSARQNCIQTPIPPLHRHSYTSEPVFLYQWHGAVMFKVIIKIRDVCEAPGTLEVFDTWRLASVCDLSELRGSFLHDTALTSLAKPDLSNFFCFGGAWFHPSSIHCVIINWTWFCLPFLV